MSTRMYEFTLTGLSPLLMHHDNLEGADSLEEWRKIPENKKKTRAGDDRFPAWTWRNCIYHDGKYVAMPTDNIRVCLMKAATRVPTANRARSGPQSFKTLIPAGVQFRNLMVPFFVSGKQIKWAAILAIDREASFKEHCEAVKALGFELYAKRAAVGQSKHVRVRPKFQDWSIKGTIDVIEDTITDQVLDDVFRIAGMYAGLGDWRPGAPKSPGSYGQFEAKLKKVTGK